MCRMSAHHLLLSVARSATEIAPDPLASSAGIGSEALLGARRAETTGAAQTPPPGRPRSLRGATRCLGVTFARPDGQRSAAHGALGRELA